MEEAPGDADALQPQDLSSCGLPSLLELTHSADEALLKAAPIDGLRVVPTPAWIINPGTSNGLLLPETDSVPLPLPADRIQPDDAFSNTTVTLSYVSRSHVFSDHSPVYGVPSSFLRAYDGGKLAVDAGDAPLSLDVEQQCLQPVSVPLGLTSCEPFGFMSPAQVVENMAALCYLQPPPTLQDVENLALETLKSLQADPTEYRFPIELQNGAANGLWNVGPFEGGFPEDSGMSVEGLQRNINPELVFLISRSQELLQQGPAGFAISLNPDLISPLDPESPPQDVFTLSEAVDHGNQQDVPMAEQTSSKRTEETESVRENAESNADSVETLDTTKRTQERKTLPLRSRRGVRMEAIVQNIQPFRSRSRSRSRSSRVCISSSSVRSARKRAPSRIRTDRREPTVVRRSRRHATSRSTSASTYSSHTFTTRRKNTSCGSTRNTPPAPVKHPPAPQKAAPPSDRKPHSGRRKRKKHKAGGASFFAPQEPEIKLKCLDRREERKEARHEAFAPYVRLHLRDFPACSVVNYREERRGKRPSPGGCGSGVMPAAPGLRYGRVCVDGAQRDVLVCCLCGASANAGALGDLHGPYYPEDFRPASRGVPAPPEDNSDSDSSCRGRWPDSFRRWSDDPDVSSVDWFSAPLVPLDAGERWLHEDCAVWSAGVFLVRGKLYGLENAVRLAKASVCSSCQSRGATLGCVCKGCPNRYHYTCALQSGCVLNEDNFSMKCRKHKKQPASVGSAGDAPSLHHLAPDL